jgi:hypothetical protein
MKAIAMVALVALLALVACGDASGRAARTQYNAGVALLGEGKLDEAEQALLAARDQAGYDDEVRFRAAFDLAAVAVARAEAAQAAQPPAIDQAMAAYEKARTWLSDAVRRRPKDPDARANLERVEARLLALIDAAGQGENALEKRLDRAIATERELRDAARALWAGQAASGGDPLAAKEQFEAAATRQRTLGAEVGTIADLAGDEITAIGGKTEDERSDEEKVRLVQLQNLDLYVQDARKAMTDARRNLHELAGELAHQRTGAALESLKRAREQLLDPIAVLQGVAADEVELARYLAALSAHAGKHDPLPAWLTARGLGGDQIDLRARLEEVKARLQAALDAPAPADGAAADPKAAEAAKVKAQVAAAMPSLEEASRQMKLASDALAAEDVAAGSTAAQASLVAIATAIEQFFALRQLIDVTLAQERDVIAAITPPAEGAEALPAAERAKRVNDGVTKNRARLARMQALIAEEQAKATAPPAADPSGAAPAAPDPQQVEQQKQLFARAEALRVEADAALAALAAVAAGGKGAPPLESAKLAEAKLVELQKLFFSVIEHLKELIRAQGETRDDTTTAQTEDDAGRAARLPGLIERQSTHGQLAEAIAQALASQADAAQQQGGQGGAPQGGPTPQALGQAAQEVRSALGSMQDATTTLTQARDQSQQLSYDIGPAIESQKTAVEHLENALRLLQPPQQQDKQDKQDQQQQQQQQQDQQQQQQQQQQQSADQQLQQVREREAQREREKRERERQAGGADPVDKDW